MMKIDRKLASMLSLCQRAGNMVSGEESVELALKNKKARLVIVAEDASQRTKEKFVDKAGFYNVNVVVYGSKDDLSACIGKFNRAVLAVAENESFAEKISELIDNALP